MEEMKDEEYVFRTDVRDKGITARSARNKRTHNGKGGRVKFPSDHLTKKELNAMNGEVKSYRLNEPMSWNEFKAMPFDIQAQYVKLLRARYKVPYEEIGKMFGVGRDTVQKHLEKQGFEAGGKFPRGSFNKDGWIAFINGAPAPVSEPVEAIEAPLKIDTPEVTPEPAETATPVKEDHISLCVSPGMGSLNFEAEYHKLHDENMVLKEKMAYLVEERKSMETEFARMRAQLDIVYLIFGGK